MSGSHRRDARERQIDERLAAVRRLMRERHAGVEPAPEFAARVAARLPAGPAWPLVWAVWRLLPVSIAVLAALLVAVALTEPRQAVTATTTVASSASGELDAVSWLLESRESAR